MAHLKLTTQYYLKSSEAEALNHMKITWMFNNTQTHQKEDFQ